MSEVLSIPVRVPEATASARRSPDRGTPCTMVILGASGDLTRRKLMPALFHLMDDGLLSEDFHVIGVGRGTMTDRAFRDAMRDAVYEESAPPQHQSWDRFADRLQYLAGDLADRSTYAWLRDRLTGVEATSPGDSAETRGRLFYLALPPGAYESTLVHLSESQLAPRIEDDAQRPWVRIVIEKPFGRNLQSALALNRLIHTRFAEHQIFRIDHYLGKETVQNLMVFRFANSIFEPVWNRDHVHHVQITAAESVGVEHRAQYYEQSGILRDMFQNHLLQLLALTAMEPPAVFRADAVRTEKIKVLDAIRAGHDIESNVVTGQYGPGSIAGKRVPGYRQEPGVAADSTTPTYAALRMFIDNRRWQGVPFFLRSGKRLPRRATEIAIQFRQPPHVMFPNGQLTEMSPNVLSFRLQPDEGISLCFEVKAPDHDLRMVTSSMDFSYSRAFGPSTHSAYETLLVDCMLGDATLFTRSDGVEAAWRVIDPIIAATERASPARLTVYPAGEWGPVEARAVIAGAGAEWRMP